MIKKTLILLVAICTMMGAEARTVRDFFVDEPGQLLMVLPKTTRLDLLDYYDADQKVFAKNNLGEGTQLLNVTDNFLHIQMSKTKDVQMLLTVNNKDTVIAVIETFALPVKDSHISFYDNKWNRLDEGKYFKMPGMESFMRKEVGKAERAELLQDIAFQLIEMTFEGDNHTTLVARHRLKEFLVAQEYKKYDKALMPSLSYTLNGTKWKQSK